MLLTSILQLAWIPLVTAFIGWLTNWVAIRMLFHPRIKKSVLGLSFHGLIPKRQPELAEKIASIVERELLNGNTIRDRLADVDLNPYLEEFAQRVVRQELGTKLQSIPLVGSMFNDNTLSMLETMATEAMQKEAGPLKEKLGDELEAKIAVKETVHQKIAELDLERLEQMVNEVAQKEFKAIELLGGVLGFVVGVAQLAIVVFLR